MPDFKITWGHWFIRIVSSVAIAFSGNCTLAQSNIVTDDTLGSENSTVIPNFGGLPIEVIINGAQRGQNLFHSFQEFNVSVGRGAYFFSLSADIQNILARVTGKNRSEVLGTLGTFGNSNPNLFLINPNGIIFGQNASLDIGGSFVATTANAVGFGNTGLFSASFPTTSNLLSINPSALFFNAISNQSEIVNRSQATTTVLGASFREFWSSGLVNPFRIRGLQTSKGESLLLVGSDIKVNGGILQASGGRVELGGLADSGTVGLKVDPNNLSLTFPDDVTRADVSFTNKAVYIDTVGSSIAINARNLDILGGSTLIAYIGQGVGSVRTQAGDITLNATGNTKVVGMGSGIFQIVRPQATSTGGNLMINTRHLLVQDGAQIGSDTSGRGNGGDLTIKADSVQLVGSRSRLFAQANSGSTGNAGNLTINTQQLLVKDGARIDAITLAKGNGGKS